MTERAGWADYAKAIGILLVVYGHVARGVFNAGIPMDAELFKLVDSIIYSFHMPLFFALSGFFFLQSLQNRGPKTLLGKKLDTVFYAYVVWSLLQGFIEASLAQYTNGNTTYGEVLGLLWDPRQQFWFLYALFLIFVVATLVFSITSCRWLGAILTVSAAIYLLQAEFYPGYHLKLIAANFVWFAFGIWLTHRGVIPLAQKGWFLALTAAGFVLLQYLFHGVWQHTYEQQGLFSLLLAAVSILFVLALSQWLARRPVALLSYIGASSMAIFLMHVIAGSGARVILQKFFGVQSAPVHLWVGAVVGVGAPLVAVYIINRFGWFYLISAPLSKLPALLQSGWRKTFA